MQEPSSYAAYSKEDVFSGKLGNQSLRFRASNEFLFWHYYRSFFLSLFFSASCSWRKGREIEYEGGLRHEGYCVRRPASHSKVWSSFFRSSIIHTCVHHIHISMMHTWGAREEHVRSIHTETRGAREEHTQRINTNRVLFLWQDVLGIYYSGETQWHSGSFARSLSLSRALSLSIIWYPNYRSHS